MLCGNQKGRVGDPRADQRPSVDELPVAMLSPSCCGQTELPLHPAILTLSEILDLLGFGFSLPDLETRAEKPK